MTGTLWMQSCYSEFVTCLILRYCNKLATKLGVFPFYVQQFSVMTSYMGYHYVTVWENVAFRGDLDCQKFEEVSTLLADFNFVSSCKRQAGFRTVISTSEYVDRHKLLNRMTKNLDILII